MIFTVVKKVAQDVYLEVSMIVFNLGFAAKFSTFIVSVSLKKLPTIYRRDSAKLFSIP